MSELRWRLGQIVLCSCALEVVEKASESVERLKPLAAQNKRKHGIA